MSDEFSSLILSRFAQISTGTAPIFNFLPPPQQAGEDRSYRGFAADHLLWLDRRFVPPSGFGEAREILDSSWIVLLDGAPGGGRLAAAQMLLHELRWGEMTFREMPLNDEDGENSRDRRLLACDAVVDGDLLLLDLSAADERYWARAHRELLDAHAEVREHGARLVVVLPHDRAERLQPTLEQYRVEIVRPAELQVLRRYLLQDGFTWDEARSASPAVDRFLSTRPRMEDVAHFALLVVGLRKRAGGAGNFTSWCQEAYAALYVRDKQVVTNMRKLPEGRQRALLLATAMLHGAHADVIHEAASTLLHEAKHPLEDLPPLQHEGLGSQFREIRAVRGDDGRVHFTDLGYDAAVRRHFWTHLPDLRASLCEWVRRTAVSQGVHQDDRDDLVDRFTELCLQERYRGVLISLIDGWTAKPLNSAGRRAAAQVLTRGLQDQWQGRFFRHAIYEWSRHGALSETLAEVIVTVCSEVMAVRHPYEAVVRLHHRARRETGTTQAREALLELVRADRRLLRLMFSRLNDQFAQDNRYGADAGLFLDLADPDLLTSTDGGARAPLARPVMREQVTVGWSVVFERSGEEVWTQRARHWLEAAGESGPWADVLIGVIVEGGRQRPPILSALYAMAGQLERSRPEWQESDVRLRDRLLMKINAVLGIQVA
ncbi:hypothetical protein [Microbispora triticiradicis]|uniref:ATP-binding protein n=2 Tax=Microbispora TaxID=2005 RepID=A0ABY3LSJ9_9ACTN|nr:MULTISPECIES: hypothetical protein [Microbispora]TLP54779.1 hypothetical protein FED44_26850 [Microbispora fusca]TYB51676.1 hypothetical protein FXF59_26220 [Microbispora tritici]